VQRRRRLRLRHVFNALLYVCRTGCQWRALPPQFPPWTAVYYYFYRWLKSCLWQRLNTGLNAPDRLREDPTRTLIGTLSVRGLRAVQLFEGAPRR